MPSPPTNHVNDSTVTMTMPNINLSVVRSISDMAELQVAHLYSALVISDEFDSSEGVGR